MDPYKKLRFKVIFVALSTGFIFSLVKIAISLPAFFNKDAALKSDLTGTFQNSNDRQLNYILSPNGILSYELILVLIFFLLGAFIFFKSTTGSKKYKKKWKRVLGTGLTILGTLVTIFSIWKN